MAQPDLTIVIPVQNEAARLAGVLTGLAAPADGIGHVHIVVVDDGSVDDSAGLAEAAGAEVIVHKTNIGKGAALRTGCDAALAGGADLIVLMDGDGQHLPEDVSRLVAPLAAGEADITLGVRSRTGQMPLARRLANWILTTWIRVLYGVGVGDSQCGMRAFSARVYPEVRWGAQDYAVESEMVVRMALRRLRSREVPISTVYLDAYKGAKPIDGVRIAWQLLKWRLRGPVNYT